MAEGGQQLVRFNAPPNLGKKETQNSLEAWEVKVKTFYARDALFKRFYNNGDLHAWNRALPNCGFLDDIAGQARDRITAPQKLAYLDLFLDNLLGYMPNTFLREEFRSANNLEAVFAAIRRSYGVETSIKSNLRLASMQLQVGEFYYQFFDRMVAHAIQHLARAGTAPVRNVNLVHPQNGDVLTISHLDTLAVLWLSKINPSLPRIVELELSDVLRQPNVSLASLVHRISESADTWLAKHDKSSIGRIASDPGQDYYEMTYNTGEHAAELEDLTHEVNRMQVNRGGYRNNRGGRAGGQGGSRGREQGGFQQRAPQQPAARGGQPARTTSPVCSYCQFTALRTKQFVDFMHPSESCTKKNAAMRLMVQDEQPAYQPPQNAAGDGEEEGGNGESTQSPSCIKNLTETLQKIISTTNQAQPITGPVEKTVNVNFIINPNQCGESAVTSQSVTQQNLENIVNSAPTDSTKFNFSEATPVDIRLMESAVVRLMERVSNKTEKSPTLRTVHNGVETSKVVADTGAEINGIDFNHALSAGIKFIPTPLHARAAGSRSLHLVGETETPVTFPASDSSNPCMISLGKVPVIRDLGTDIIIGQPGLRDNQMYSIAHLKELHLLDDTGLPIVLKYPPAKVNSDPDFAAVKAIRTESVQPGSLLEIRIPHSLRSSEKVVAVPRKETSSWFPCSMIKTNDGHSTILNTTNENWLLTKNMHFADLRRCTEVDLSEEIKDIRLLLDDQVPQLCRVYNTDAVDLSQFENPKPVEPDLSCLEEISVDPDNILSPEQKELFRLINCQYLDVLNRSPGRYNGSYGHIDNSINFIARPPSSNKVHLPKYNPKMLQSLADLMDELHEKKVLVKPEEIGVVPEFMMNSFLVPKKDPDTYRLVTDMTPLNQYIRKQETVMPTIEETKSILSRKKYFIQTDLTQCYFQHGISKEDSQWLGTYHPHKGTMVYTVSVMGLRNSQEHSTEMLRAVLHDLLQDERVAIQADAVFPLGDTIDDLAINYLEVLNRFRQAGLTLKPKATIIAPTKLILWGWKLSNQGWLPTGHVKSSLASADLPSTVKKLRSFIGAFKQLSRCVEGYASKLGPLEDLHAGKNSNEKISWTKESTEHFENIKKSLSDLSTISVPRPDDKLVLFSDWCQQEKAIGGRMEIHRLMPDGSTKILNGGHFSARANGFQKQWLACDGESLAIRTTIKHFLPHIRQSSNEVCHFTDNSPCVHAWERAKRGHFSSSARISTFLSSLSTENIVLKHRPGKYMHQSDHASRHPTVCNEGTDCQICKFVREEVQTGDRAVPLINFLSVSDIESGRSVMPFLQPSAWSKIQKADPAHKKLDWLLLHGQRPEKKQTKGVHTQTKHLYTLYKSGRLHKTSDGVYKVKHTDPESGIEYSAISVPLQMYPGLLQAIHLRLRHPLKTQLLRLSKRYFYGVGMEQLISEITDACYTCAKLKRLPPDLLKDENTELVEQVGQEFAADVVQRDKQAILIVREKLSSFAKACFVENQSAETLQDAIIDLVLPIMADGGSTVRVDCAPAFKSLETSSALQDSPFKKNNIKLELGNHFNVNKNPVAERLARELHAALRVLSPGPDKLSNVTLQEAIRDINDKRRGRGLTAKEMLLRRHHGTGEEANWIDRDLGQQQNIQRKKMHKKNPDPEDLKFNIGDNVFRNEDGDKTHQKELYRVTDIIEEKGIVWYLINKCDNKFMAKSYKVRHYQISEAPGFNKNIIKNKIDEIQNELENIEELEPEAANENHKNQKKEDENKPERKAENQNENINAAKSRPRRKAAVGANNTIKEIARNENNADIFQIQEDNEDMQNIYLIEMYYWEPYTNTQEDEDLEKLLLEKGNLYDDEIHDPGLLFGHLADLDINAPPATRHIVHVPQCQQVAAVAVDRGAVGGVARQGPTTQPRPGSPGTVPGKNCTLLTADKYNTAELPHRQQYSDDDSPFEPDNFHRRPHSNPAPLRQPYHVLPLVDSSWPYTTDHEGDVLQFSSLESILKPKQLFSPRKTFNRLHPSRRAVRAPNTLRGRPTASRGSAMGPPESRSEVVRAPRSSRLVPPRIETTNFSFFSDNLNRDTPNTRRSKPNYKKSPPYRLFFPDKTDKEEHAASYLASLPSFRSPRLSGTTTPSPPESPAQHSPYMCTRSKFSVGKTKHMKLNNQGLPSPAYSVEDDETPRGARHN